MFDTIDYSPGRVMWDNLKYINTSLSLSENERYLDQDLVFVQYDSARYLIIDWYSLSNTHGLFVVRASAYFQNENTFFFKTTRSYKKLYQYINQAIDLIRAFLRHKQQRALNKRFVDLSDITFPEGHIMYNKFIDITEDVDCLEYPFESNLFSFDAGYYSIIVGWKEHISGRKAFRAIVFSRAKTIIFCRWSYDLAVMKDHLKIAAAITLEKIMCPEDDIVHV